MASELVSYPTPIRFTLKTPALRFERVQADGSEIQPIVVGGPEDTFFRLEVIVPPLAPFSISKPPHSTLRRAGETSGVRIWIRYDARSGTAWDNGEIVISTHDDARSWTVPLFGCGHLARDIH